MSPETLEALKASIAHWEANVAAREPSEASVTADECALCGLFDQAIETEKTRCKRCPVFKRTGRQLCKKSPFQQAADLWFDWSGAYRTGCDPREAAQAEEFRKAAQAELEFLRSLLPADEAKP